MKRKRKKGGREATRAGGEADWYLLLCGARLAHGQPQTPYYWMGTTPAPSR